MDRHDVFRLLNPPSTKHAELPSTSADTHTSRFWTALSTHADGNYLQPLPEVTIARTDFDPRYSGSSVKAYFSWPSVNPSDWDEDPLAPAFPSASVADDDDDTSDDAFCLPDYSDICSVEDAFQEKWRQEGLDERLNGSQNYIKSPKELTEEIRPVMAKQDLAHAYHSTALLLAQTQPLISMEHHLYHRRGASYDMIDNAELYDILCDVTDKSVHGGIKKSGRSELYSAVASVRSIQISSEDIIRNPNLIPLIDQIYDLESGRCHEPRSDEHFFSRINLHSSELGTGDGRLLEKFLDTSFAGDSHAIERFLQTQGTILSPFTPKAIFHYWGPHDCGKSEAVRLDMLFLTPRDRYVHSIDDPNKLIERFALAPLQGKRLCYCPDASKITFKESTCALLKQLAGGRDLIGTEAKNRPHFTFVNEAKLLFLSNHRLRGEFDDAFLSRLVTVPFRQTVPPEKRIPDLAEKIFKSRGYYFMVVMQALRNLIDNNFVFQPVECDPSYVTPESGWNGVASGHDSIWAFGTDRCVMDAEAFTPSQVLFEEYLCFCSENGFAPISEKSVFGRTLHSAFPEIRSKRTSAYHGFTGIRIREVADTHITSGESTPSGAEDRNIQPIR